MLSCVLGLTLVSFAQEATAELFVGPLPKFVVLKTLIRYDSTVLENRLKGNHANFTPYIDEVILRTKKAMMNLDIPVNLEIIDIEYFPHNITTFGSALEFNRDMQETRFVSYISDNPGKIRGGGGVANHGDACKTDGNATVLIGMYPFSIMENTWAHELGHQIGLR